MRIVLAAEGTRGDIFPMLALGAGLRARGHRVALAAPPDFASDAAAWGLESRSVGAPVRPALDQRAGRLLRGSWSALRECESYLAESIRAQFDALPALLEDADLVVAAGVEMAAASVAEQRGIPYRYILYCPALLPSAEYPPVMVSAQRLPRPVNRALWRVLLALQNRMLGAHLDAGRARLGLGPVADPFRHLVGARPILAADAELAPVPPDAPFPVDQVSCLHAQDPASDAALPPKLEAFLAQGPPPVYVGFGSMPDMEPAATTARVVQAIERAGCRALLAEGWARLGGGPLPEGVLAIGAVDHTLLFPRVAAVVHHGGAGTTTTAARAGTPQIVVPHLLDQFYWGERVRVLGLGPPALPRRRLRAEGLADALLQVLENELLAERAREFGARLRARVTGSLVLDHLLS